MEILVEEELRQELFYTYNTVAIRILGASPK